MGPLQTSYYCFILISGTLILCIFRSTNFRMLHMGDSQTNYVKGSNKQRLHSSLSISWNQQQPPLFFIEHIQKWKEWSRESSSCSQIREVAVMVDPASTQAGQIHFLTNRREETGREVETFKEKRQFHWRRKLWPGFYFTSSFICRAPSLNKVENNGHERLFWPQRSWGVL